MNSNQDPKWLKNISVNMVVEAGKTEKSVDEILLWRKGTTIKLDDSSVNVLRVYINNQYFAYGDVLRNVDGEMSLRVSKVLLDERGLTNVSQNIDM
ncbi:FliM/FliN family flagellar motor switch protein [Priestia aryabhattai]